MSKRSLFERILFNISRFVSFYLVISLVIIATIILFLRDMELNEALIRQNSGEVFILTVVLSAIGCVLDMLRRRQTIDKPLRPILSALEKIRQGDYSVRLDSRLKDFSQAGLREISLGINQLAQELGGVESLRTDFIANVSHELKTPLAAVSNYATLLQDPDLPEERRQEYVRAIMQTTRRLADLVANILKLSKLENQQIFPQTQVFDLGEQLCESMLEFETAWEQKGLELDCKLAENVLVEADPELLKLVWSNLFSNAVKFTPRGGKITLTLQCDGPWATVSVSDTGCGMDRQTGTHIFEKFYQGDTAHAAQGNGLGLALVKRVVDITGGVITVSSTPGKGSTFTVRLGRIENGAV